MADEIKKLLDSMENAEHPMLKVMKAAYNKAKNADKNGNYKVYSDELGEKNPPHFSATVQKQGNNCSLLEVKNISNGVAFSKKAAYNIILSEKELAKHPDPIATNEAFKIIQQITKHGKIIRLEEKDRQEALKNARKVVTTEKLPEIPAKVKNEILNITNWDLLSGAAKSVAGMQWAKKIGGKTMVLINDEETTGKDKVRALILFVQQEV